VKIADDLAARLYERSGAASWGLPAHVFAEALAASASKAFTDASPAKREIEKREIERYLESLRIGDLALACACASGSEPAWDHFVREFRPVLYRSADAVDPGGGLREIADSLYADLYGLDERGGKRQSLFRYYHGRSSLATWLRAVLAQRHVDRIRAQRRVEPLPERDEPAEIPERGLAPDPDRRRLLPLVQHALTLAVRSLEARDRLRLACYYVQKLTLAEIARVTGEHEATASRHLTRIRRELREGIELELRDKQKLSAAEIAQARGYVMDDAGALDLGRLLAERKESVEDRSK
jgi:RNA polymerase sigma-70 factor